jgi:predicted CXXCH cytochrome family protein
MAIAVLAACGGGQDAVVESPPQADSVVRSNVIQDGYVGSGACADCHQEESAAWQESRHNGIFRPGAEPVWKDNPPPAFESEELAVAPSPDGRALVVERGGALGRFSIDAVIGGARMESYATHLDDGAWLLLPLSYQVNERTFIPYTEGTCGIEVLGGGKARSWQSFDRVWNHRCISCHTTAGNIGFSPGDQRYDTTWVDPGAGCESCHGPGAEHVAAAQAGGEAGSILNPAQLEARESAEICASCHALSLPFETRWGGNRPYRPGDDWNQAFLPLLRPAEQGPFAGLAHVDRRPAAGVMAYQGLEQSSCFLQGGATCATCHDPHGGGGEHQLKSPAEGTGLCSGCHAEVVAAGEDHTRHPAGRPGSACIDCHMPPAVETLGTRVASHAIDVPLPINNVEFGIPDACSSCHGDRGAQWAADSFTELWGDPEDRRRRRLAGAFGKPDVEALRAILHDEGESQLLRADAAAALAGQVRRDALPDLIQVLDSEAPVIVRRFTADLIGGMSAMGEVTVARQMQILGEIEAAGAHDALRRAIATDDPALRLGAASALARLGATDGLELLQSLADDPVLAGGYRLHHALGRYNMLSGNLEAAAAGFEKVLEFSPNYLDAIQELGFIYFSTERFRDARDLWMRGLALDPDNEDLRLRVHLAEDEMRKHGLLPPVSGG